VTTAAQRLRDAVAKTVAIGNAVSQEANAIKAEASQATQGNTGTGGSGDVASDRPGA